MTAHRVITDHNELENVGATPHTQIDNFIQNTSFIVVSGSISGSSAERQLAVSSGLLINDTGPGGQIIISIDPSFIPTGSSGPTTTKSIWSEIPSGTKDGVNSIFSLERTPYSDSIHLYANGILQYLNEEYTVSSSNVIFSPDNVPTTRDRIIVSYEYESSRIIWNEIPSGIKDGINDTFALDHQPILNSIHLYMNGILQYLNEEYTVSSSNVVFASDNIPTSRDRIIVSYEW